MLRTSEFMGRVHDMVSAHASQGRSIHPEAALSICKLMSLLKLQCEAMELRLAGDPALNVINADNVTYLHAWSERNSRDRRENEEPKQ